jgi:hypothetical protein
MAHGDTALLAERTETEALPAGLLAGLTSFAEAHGGATAIIEYVGRRGARIVLVGDDGSWGDRFAPDTDVARQACAEAEIPVEKTWERELISKMAPSQDLWRSMARRSLAR